MCVCVCVWGGLTRCAQASGQALAAAQSARRGMRARAAGVEAGRSFAVLLFSRAAAAVRGRPPPSWRGGGLGGHSFVFHLYFIRSLNRPRRHATMMLGHQAEPHGGQGTVQPSCWRRRGHSPPSVNRGLGVDAVGSMPHAALEAASGGAQVLGPAEPPRAGSRPRAMASRSGALRSEERSVPSSGHAFLKAAGEWPAACAMVQWRSLCSTSRVNLTGCLLLGNRPRW